MTGFLSIWRFPTPLYGLRINRSQMTPMAGIIEPIAHFAFFLHYRLLISIPEQAGKKEYSLKLPDI